MTLNSRSWHLHARAHSATCGCRPSDASACMHGACYRCTKALVMDALCAKDRAPEGAQRFRIGNLHKRALTEPDATTADSPCPRAPFLPNRRRHRRCYGHMAGELGVAQFEMLMRKQYLEPNDQGLQLTHAGRKWTEQLGLEVSKKSTARFAYPCMDWSERKDHLAGSLAKALLELYVAKNWLRAPKESRALELTYLGQQALMPLLKST